MKKFLSEFRDFALKGNVMNLAVGVIIGAAFQSIVSSLTNDILSPILGLFTGTNLDALTLTVMGDVNIRYGSFIANTINFVIMAFVVFLLVKCIGLIMAIGKKQAAPEAPSTVQCPFCMTDINAKAKRCPACTSILEVK